MAAPTFVNFTTQNTGNATLAASKPTGVVDDDILTAHVMSYLASPTTVPTGWSLLGSATSWRASLDSRVNVYTKVASGEGSSWTWTCGNGPLVIHVSAFRGEDTTNPVHLSTVKTTATGAPAVGTTLTPTVSKCMIVALATLRDNAATTGPSDSLPSGYATGYNVSDARFGAYQSMAYLAQGEAAATGALAFGLNGHGADNSIVHTIALTPGAPGQWMPVIASYVS